MVAHKPGFVVSDHPVCAASVASRHFLLAQPPLLSEEGNVGECGLLICLGRFTRLFLLLGLLFTPSLLLAETGYNSWLRYSPLDQAAAVRYRQTLPAAIATLSGAAPVQSGQQEIIVGTRRMLGRTLRATSGMVQHVTLAAG